ncbi:MAG: F0F1 ATP synthase subunit B [Candidatus Omnitrophica bacterium]|nr:F0F1 ATP synthase subunit B [Candidatus Omnitrophota bacterium]
MELLKLLSANEIVAQVITFLLLLFLMKRFAWKPFLKTLDTRKERIASELKRIEAAKAEVNGLKTDYESRLASIEAEAKNRIRAAVEEGRKSAEDIRRLAREDGERIFAKAQESIKAEVAKAEEALKDKIVNLTIDVASKVVQERLTEEDDRAIVETFIKEMEKK